MTWLFGNSEGTRKGNDCRRKQWEIKLSLRVACQVETREIFSTRNMESWKVVSDSTRQQDSRRKQRDKLGLQAKARWQRCQGTEGTLRELERALPSIPLQTGEPEDKKYKCTSSWGSEPEGVCTDERVGSYSVSEGSPLSFWPLVAAQSPCFLKCKC